MSIFFTHYKNSFNAVSAAIIFFNLTELYAVDEGKPNPTPSAYPASDPIFPNDVWGRILDLNITRSQNTVEQFQNIFPYLSICKYLQQLIIQKYLSPVSTLAPTPFQDPRQYACLHFFPNLKSLFIDFCSTKCSPFLFHSTSHVLKNLIDNPYLSTLSLFNGLSLKEAPEICHIIQNNTALTELNLIKMNLKKTGIDSIVAALARNTSFKKLNLYKNYIGKDGALSLMKGLSCHTTLQSLTIMTLQGDCDYNFDPTFRKLRDQLNKDRKDLIILVEYERRN